MVLPALARGKAKAKDITCVNNLKQAGLGTRMWASDQGDKTRGAWTPRAAGVKALPIGPTTSAFAPTKCALLKAAVPHGHQG